MLPTKEQISNAVEKPSSFIASQLKGYKTETGILGPDQYSGGFCMVFPINNGINRKALRVWHTEITNIKERYKLISEDIAHANLPFLTNVEYIERGIKVGTEYVDITLMDWIDGLPLKKYIEQILDSAGSASDKQKQLKQLAYNLFQVFKSMHKANFSHGDLQHSNIIVKEDGSIALIDYDNFYTPSLHSNYLQTTTGCDGYQHPANNNRYSSKKDDYFAELVIYLSILSFAKDFSLWDISKDDDHALLLTISDYVNLQQSKVFQKLKQLGGELFLLCQILEEYLGHQNINELIPFEICLLQRKISFTVSTPKAVRNTQSIELTWEVPAEAEIYLHNGNEIVAQGLEKKGKFATTLSESTTFELSIKTSEGQEIKKEVTIEVFDECKIDFKADKQFVFPSIPVVLSWNVTNAKKVWLDDKEVEPIGKRVIEPKMAMTCVLSAQDEFGKKSEQIEIGMLPIPLVKSLLVPTPNIVNNLSITIKQPRFNVNVSFPQITIGMVKTKMPKVPSFTDLGLNVELPPPLPGFSIKRTMRKLFNKISKK